MVGADAFGAQDKHLSAYECMHWLHHSVSAHGTAMVLDFCYGATVVHCLQEHCQPSTLLTNRQHAPNKHLTAMSTGRQKEAV